MATVTCNCNAGTERSFLSRTAGGDTNLSKHQNFDVFFDLDHPNQPTEKRQLRVVDRTTGKAILEVPLNENGGLKPTLGQIAAHQPLVLSRPRPNVSIDTDQERLFFANVNLSADAGIDLRFIIDPEDEQTDKRRFLSFQSIKPNFPAALKGLEINLNAAGGKKPLEGGGVGLHIESDSQDNDESQRPI
jgi:hypothetical protein